MDETSPPHGPLDETPPPETPDDLIDPSLPLDPAQWAIHGILSVYFERAGQDASPRVQTILERIVRERQRVAVAAAGEPPTNQPREPAARRTASAFITAVRIQGRALAGMASAAAILIALLLIWSHTGSGRAMALDLREIGFAPPLPMVDLWLDPGNEEAYLDALKRIEDARIELQRARTINDPTIIEPWIAWTELYRTQRNIGLWEEALAEATAFTEYARKRNEQPQRYSMYYSALADVAGIHLAIGDYENATAYYLQAAQEGREFQQWRCAPGSDTDPRPHALEHALTGAVCPYLWMLSRVAAAQGDQETAWDYLNEAEEILIDFCRKECLYLELPVASGASLIEMARRIAPTDDHSTPTNIVLIRQHLLHKATLLRLDRDAEAALATLEDAESLPYFAERDDFRQDFHIPMEELRIHIARGDFAAALTAADEAALHTGSREFPLGIYQPPIGVLARAELRFLRGTALAGLDPKDPEALKLVESAVGTLENAAATLSDVPRDRLLKARTDWGKVADDLGQAE